MSRFAVAGLTFEIVGAADLRRYRRFAVRARPELRLFVTRRVCESPYRGAVAPRLFYERGLHRFAFERPELYGEADLRRGVGRLVIAPRRTALDTALRVMLTAALLPRDVLLVHALGTRDGTLFPGESGAGKSTLGRRAGDAVLSDEIVALAPGAIHATPFWGDGRPPQRRGRAPHRRTCFLRRGAPAGIRPIPRVDAYAELLSCITFFADADRAVGRVLRLARRAVTSRPTMTLGYDPQRHRWPEIRRWIDTALD